MTPTPLDQIGLRPRDHHSALWWLGLVYRRPDSFRKAVAKLTWGRAILSACLLYLHFLPYQLMIATLGTFVTVVVVEGLDLPRPALSWLQVFGVSISMNLGALVISIELAILFSASRAAALAIETMVTRINKWIAICVLAVIALLGVITNWEVSAPMISGAIGIGIGIWFWGSIIRWISFGIAEGISTAIALGLAASAINLPAIMIGREELLWLSLIGLGMGWGIPLGIIRSRWIGLSIVLLFGAFAWLNSSFPSGLRSSLFEIFQPSTWLFFMISAGITLLRAYYWPYHLPFVWPALKPDWYRWHPVAWDDLCVIPFPGLDRLLAAFAETEPEEGDREITRLIDTYPSQRMNALRAKARLIARAAGRESRLSRLDSLVASLPEGEEGFLRWTAKLKGSVSEIAEIQRRLDTQDRPFLRESSEVALCKTIENFQGQIAGYPEPLRSEFRQAASQWLSIAKAQHGQVRAVLDREPRPQVFRAGDPVDRNQEAFVKREGVLGDLDRQLTLATGCPGLILYGRRRMGKSTLLRNLDGFLPVSTRVAVVSMQNPDAFTSQGDLLNQLSKHCLAVWAEDHRPVTTTSSLLEFFKLLAACNNQLESTDRHLLLAIDEYENLDRKLGEAVFQEDLLATVRESIQYHRRLIWVFAGSHAIDELTHAPWPSYLISAGTIDIPPFTEAETRRLLTEPLRYSPLLEKSGLSRPRFAPDFWGEGGIERIHEESAGWPHLVQLLAGTAVDLCNDGDRHTIDGNVLDQAIAKSVVTGDTVLRQLLRGEANEAEWAYLSRFRQLDTQPVPDDEAVYLGLRRRLLVADTGNGEWRLRVPLMLHWLRERG